MYTNIDTTYALRLIDMFLKYLPLTTHVPNTDIIVAALELIMKNNIFQFNDTYWLQTDGTAMGSPPACCYAIIYYGIHETKSLLRQFLSPPDAPDDMKPLRFYRGYIDDVFGVWHHHPDPAINAQLWTSFQEALPFGNLRWTVNQRTRQTNFLDLQIELQKTISLSSPSTKSQ